jgi:hypothetical protein
VKDSRYCRDLLDLDESIVVAVIANQEGNVVGIAWKEERLPWKSGDLKSKQTFSTIVDEKLGTWMQIILSLASQTSPLIGKFERACFVHANYQLVMLSSATDKVIGVMIGRSADAEHVAGKIREFTG